MSQFGNWRVLSRDLAEFVRDAGPPVALVGSAIVAILVLPGLLGACAHFLGSAS